MSRSQARMAILAAMPLFVFITLLTLRAPKAYAALAGQDGVIVTVDQGVVEGDTSVAAMQPDGTSPTTIVEETDPASFISSATVSAPQGTSVADQTNTVVYSQTTDNCYVQYEEEILIDNEVNIESIVLPGGPKTATCTEEGQEYSHQVVTLNTVTIDANGNPVSAPQTAVTIGDDEDRHEVNVVLNSSVSPDTKQVVIVRYTQDGGIFDDNEMLVNNLIERVTLADGTIETIVSTGPDETVNAGYGQNGNIYYSYLVDNDDDEGATSDVWFIAAGQPISSARRITNEGNVVFIDASPDNTKLLVQNGKSYGFVDLTDGCLDTPVYCSIMNIDTELMPVFFSPTGTRIAGITFNAHKARVAIDSESEVVTSFMNVAVASTGDLTSPLAIANKVVAGFYASNLAQIEWAPKLAAATPQVLGTSTTAVVASTVSNKLVNTGVNASLTTLLATALLGTSLVTLLKKREN